jgi:hypothetical protein
MRCFHVQVLVDLRRLLWRPSCSALRETGDFNERAARIVGAFGCMENEQLSRWFNAVRAGFHFPPALP